MSLLNYADYVIAAGQSLLAVLLWHRAEPRMRIARGSWQAYCTLLLGFVLAFSVVLSLSRPLAYDPLNWQRSVRDCVLLVYAMCMYRRAMQVKPAGLA